MTEEVKDIFDRPERKRPGDIKGYLKVQEFPDQIGPSVFPEYPRPWSLRWKGDGHFDVLAANGAYVANVFCWDASEVSEFGAKLRAVNRNEEDAPVVPPYC